MSGALRLGTSGWVYEHWAGPFYPADLPRSQWLAWYARHFNAVEVNASFYHLPRAETLRQWADSAPEGFVFACKASRYLTHMKKLREPGDPLARLFERLRLLGPHLGPVLYQLPPHWHYNGERLAAFLEQLPGDARHVFEFRDPSWINDEALALLQRFGAAFCIHDFGGQWTPAEVRSGLAYLRFHGPEPGYRGRYDEATLARWAERIRHWRAEGIEVHAYFNNDVGGQAPADARRLLALCQPP